MLTTHHLLRLLERQDAALLLRALESNGLALNLPLISRLSRSMAGPRALALPRMLDLSYGQPVWVQPLIDDLIQDVLTDSPQENDPLILALQLTALERIEQEQLTHDKLEAARHLLLGRLAELQQASGAFVAEDDYTQEDQWLTSVYIYLTLQRCSQAAMILQMGNLRYFCEQAAGQMQGLTRHLWELASQPVIDSHLLSSAA